MTNRETRAARYADEGGDDRRRPSRKKSDNTPLIIGAVFVVAVVAIGGAGFLNRAKTKAAATTPETAEDPYAAKPFADIPAEEGPGRLSPGGGPARTITNNSPAGLMAEPIWTESLVQANAAFALSDEAEAAKASGDNETYLTKAVQAKKQMDEAIIATADWELDIQSKYGDEDAQVRKIGRERDKWFKLLRKYHGLHED